MTRRHRATRNSRRRDGSDSCVRPALREKAMKVRIGSLLRGVAAAALLCLTLESLAQTAAPDQEPLGVGLEGFVYPYPVQYLMLRMDGVDVKMAFMDVEPT